MARFARCRVVGEYEGTAVESILYYTWLPANIPGFLLAELTALGERVRDAWDANVRPLMAAGYDLLRVDVQQVNEFNETAGSLGVSVLSPTAAGGIGGGSDTAAVTTIFRFTTTTLTGFSFRRPKRSYVAIGPIPSSLVTNDDQHLYTTTNQAQIAAALVQNHVIGLQIWTPVRVGQRNAAGAPSVGSVLGGGMDELVSVRRSRLKRSKR